MNEIVRRNDFVQRNDPFLSPTPLFRYRFRRNAWNAKGQWNIGKCLNMPASVRTVVQMPLWNTVQSPFFNRRHCASRVNSPCHTIHSRSTSLVNVYSLSLIPRKYAFDFAYRNKRTLWGVKLFSYCSFYRVKNTYWKINFLFFISSHRLYRTFILLRRDIFKIFYKRCIIFRNKKK